MGYILNYADVSFHCMSQSEAVMSAHGEVSQKSALKRENVRDVSIPMLL